MLDAQYIRQFVLLFCYPMEAHDCTLHPHPGVAKNNLLISSVFFFFLLLLFTWRFF